ncbi:MAG: PAS domain S-box protein [Deltaproteobacteria bacterium]|nr:PAS domain S-box protein [Deltaproteobacteria bacterium]
MRRRIAELEKSETEHKQAKEALRQSENKFRSLAEKSLVGIYLIQDGIFRYVNPKLAEIFDYRVEELIGKRGPRDLTLQEDWPVVEKALCRRISGRVKSIHYDFRGITKNKEIIYVEVYGSRTTYQGRPAVIGTLSDITESRRVEEKIRHLNLVLRAIRKVNQLIIREKDRNRLLKEACRLLIKTRGYHSAWTAILDESNKLITTAQAGLGKDFSKMVKLLRDGKLPNCGQRALSQPKVVVIKNPLSICTDCPLVGKYHNRAAMTIRLEHREKIYGLLSVSIPRGLVGDKEEQSLFREVASDLALAMREIELEEERKRAKQKLQKTLEKTIHALASAIEMRDPYTAGHQKRVTKLACAIAKEMDLSKEQIEGIRMAGLIHDIGKISIPFEILTKPGKLNDLECSLIKTHPQAGYNILKGIEFPWPVA